jgi:hypothetical protein
MTTSVLVAFRDSSDEQWRRRLWDFIRARLRVEHPDFEIIEGSDDGEDPFNKCQAINRAAAVASGEVFYILDCDTWVPPAHVFAALEGIRRDPGSWWRPYTVKVKLLKPATLAALEAGPEWRWNFDRRARHERVTNYWAAPPLLIPHALFEDVGGMDGNPGWGQEDEIFGQKLKALHGELSGILGHAVHLWHPRIGQSGRDMWPGQESFGPNIALARQYQRAARSEQTMRALIAERLQPEEV